MLFAVLLLLVLCTSASGRVDLTRKYHLKRCPGLVHAGLTPEDRKHATGYGRYRQITCRRARRILMLIDDSVGSFPTGYGWQTPHGLPRDWPTVFGQVLVAAYLAPDGWRASRRSPGLAVVLFKS